jgi:hypothetical protein
VTPAWCDSRRRVRTRHRVRGRMRPMQGIVWGVIAVIIIGIFVTALAKR